MAIGRIRTARGQSDGPQRPKGWTVNERKYRPPPALPLALGAVSSTPPAPPRPRRAATRTDMSVTVVLPTWTA